MVDKDLPFWRAEQFKVTLTAGLVLAVVGGCITVAVNIVSAHETASSKSSAPGQKIAADAAGPSTRPNASVTDSAATKIDNTGGWGPSRKAFTGAAPYVVLNSLTDLPNYGDERNFFTCHDLADKDQSGGGWNNNILAKDQHTYQCELFYDNDISGTLDPSPSVGGQENIGVMLQNARARVQLPEASTYNPALWGFASADNSNPSEVWDAVNFISPKKVTLTYAADSARLFTLTTPKDGAQLKSEADLTGNGVLVGEKQDGNVGQGAGYILLNVKVSLS